MLGQKEVIQLVFTFDCVPRYIWNFAAFRLTYSWAGHWTFHIISKVAWVQFCRRNAQSTKPLVLAPTLTIHHYIFQNNLFGKMNLHKNSEPHYEQNLYREWLTSFQMTPCPKPPGFSPCIWGGKKKESSGTGLRAIWKCYHLSWCLLETILTTAAKRCLKIKITTKGRRNQISFNKKWFDKEMFQEARTMKTGQSKTPRSSQY